MQQDYTKLKQAMDIFRECFKKNIIGLNEIAHSVEFLKTLSPKTAEQLTYNEAFRLYNIIKPFSTKLKKLNFDFSTVPAIRMPIKQNNSVTVQQPSGRVIGYDGSRFVVRFPYSIVLYDAIKTIPGRLWDNEKKIWFVPITSTSQLKQFAHGFNFEVGDAAFSMMNNVHENLENSYSAEYIELNLPVKKDFYPFQTVGVDYVHKNKRVIIGDQMGLGKTVQGIGGILINEAFPALVICPKGLRLNWRDEWQAWTNKRVMVLDKNNVKQLKYLIENKMIDVVITNYDGVNTHFVQEIKDITITSGPNEGTVYQKVYTNGLEKLFKSVVLDEAHNCRNKSTLRYKTVKKCFEEKEVRICLTGTPIVKGPQDLAALLELIDRIDEFGGHYKFVRQYKGMDKKFLAMQQKDAQKVSDKERAAANVLRELNIKLRSLCFIRREKHQVLKELPDKFRKVIRVPLENQKEYDHIMLSLQDYMAKNGASNAAISTALKAEMLVRINLLKQVSAKGKFTAVKEFAEEVVSQGEKLIIVCWFNDTVQYLKNHLPGAVTICGRIDGRNMTDEEIQVNKKKFQEDPDCKVIIITYGKGSEGHTLTAASKVAFIELGWTYKDQGQAEDRAHRIGQKGTVECYYFLGEHTIDEHIYKIIDSRRELEKQTTGGNEQVETTFAALTKEMFKTKVAA